MRNALSLQLALVTAVCLCATPLCAQYQSSPSDNPSTTDRLNAVVVSSIDGKPVPRVLVTSADRRMAAMTDSEGRFSFDLHRSVSSSESHVFSSFPPSPISSASYIPIQFLLRKPGYLTDGVNLRLPAAAPATPEPTLQLKIVPAGVLTGHLYPDSGDLPAYASVQLRGKQTFNGTSIWSQLSVAQVNSRGEFRFANLRPGDYKLLAPAIAPTGNLPGAPSDSIPGFRAAFYPNASGIDAATPIHISAGESVTANLAIHSATFYRVTIPVTGLPDSTGFYVNPVTEIPGLNFTQAKQSAQAYLPSGDYSLLLSSAPTDARAASIAFVHLQVEAKPLRTEPAAFHPGLEVPVLVQREFTNPPPEDRQHPNPVVQVNVRPLIVGRLQPSITPRPGTAEVATIGNLSEGLFHVDVYSTIGGYVASLTSGTTDLLREPLQVLAGSAPRPIEIVLRDDPASLTARIALDPTQPQAMEEQPVILLCLPLDRPETQPIISGVQREQFTIPLPPGRYLLLASRGQGLLSSEYRNPDVLRDLLPKGVTITLSPNQKADIEVPLMPDGAN